MHACQPIPPSHHKIYTHFLDKATRENCVICIQMWYHKCWLPNSISCCLCVIYKRQTPRIEIKKNIPQSGYPYKTHKGPWLITDLVWLLWDNLMLLNFQSKLRNIEMKLGFYPLLSVKLYNYRLTNLINYKVVHIK